MAYKIGGTELSLQPSSGRWVILDPLGIGISGMARYPAVKQFELLWDLMPLADYAQLYSLYESQSLTGTYVVELPDIEDNAWAFREFSGAVINHPTAGEYFQEHISDVSLVIRNIRT
jgi:hypothetical protein